MYSGTLTNQAKDISREKGQYMEIRVHLLTPNAKVPSKAHDTDAGWDLSVISDAQFVNGGYELSPGEVRKFRTGVCLGLPPNTFMMIKARSGMGSRGIDVFAGVCDCAYTGEYMVVLKNAGDKPYLIEQGDRIAQAILLPLLPANTVLVESLEQTDRGEKGFSSSGR